MSKQNKRYITAEAKKPAPKKVMRGILTVVKFLFVLLVIGGIIAVGKGIYDAVNGIDTGDVLGFFGEVGTAIANIFKK